MSIESQKEKIRIDLTPDQQKQVFDSVGKTVDSIELSSTELEERIAPRVNLHVE